MSYLRYPMECYINWSISLSVSISIRGSASTENHRLSRPNSTFLSEKNPLLHHEELTLTMKNMADQTFMLL